MSRTHSAQPEADGDSQWRAGERPEREEAEDSRASRPPLPVGPPRALPHTLRHETMLRLQRSVGNRQAGRQLAPKATPARGPARPAAHGETQGLAPSLAGERARAARPRRIRRSPAPRRIQRFEAQHHEHIERGALAAPSAQPGASFTDAEATAVYFGNWSRDLSQAFVNSPILHVLGLETLFELLNVVAVNKFGRELNPRDFGVYSPREHIDNPAGQINADLLREGQRQILQAPPSQQFATPEEDISSPEAVRRLFTVNEAGLPAYLGRSVQYVEEELSTAADLGRTAEGLMHFGNGLHTIEDLFAHSNYVEIALGSIVDSLGLDRELQRELDERREDGLDPIETFSGRTAGGRPIVMTGSFVTADTLISISEAITAFLAEFDPFSASNSERSQRITKLLLKRYEQLAKTGEAGEIARSFMSALASSLNKDLARQDQRGAASSEAPPEGASLWSRVAAGAKGLAVRLGGRALGSTWVQSLIARGVNAIGLLPLTKIYDFITQKTKEIDQIFEGLLGLLPEALRQWVDKQRNELRERLKAPIRSAIRFMGQLLQRVFAEATVAESNIEVQIRQQIAQNVRDPEARRQLAAATPEQQAALLSNPEWCARARMEPAALEALRELVHAPDARKIGLLQDAAWCARAGLSPEQAERLRQMIQAPAYVRHGPSHSQVAKDHADSPFFGIAAALAGHAVRNLRDLMVAVWEAEGRNRQRDPKLMQNYSDEIPPAIAGRMAPPGTPAHLMTPDQRLAERQAAEEAPHYKELRRRRVGEALLREGALPESEVDHGVDEALEALEKHIRALGSQLEQLPARLSRIADRIAGVAPGAAGELRALAGQLPRGLSDLAEQIDQAGDAEALQRLAARLRALAAEQEGIVARAQEVLRRVARRVEGADPALRAAADELRSIAAATGSLLPALGQSLRGLADKLAERAATRARSREQIEAIRGLPPVQTGDWSPELAASHARPAAGHAMSPQRQALFAYVREVFSHPYDTHWWREVTTRWVNSPGNRERLAAYIRARNSEEIHHHH